MADHCGHVPPSAAGHLEPYACKVTLQPDAAGPALDPAGLLVQLLDGLAAACMEAGATIIGHLKCLLHVPTGTLACNLASVRSGARCAGGAAAPQSLQPGEPARLDLVVLVYGLPASTIAELVRRSLAQALGPAGQAWVVDGGESTSAS
jgi:hypothetical protein